MATKLASKWWVFVLTFGVLLGAVSVEYALFYVGITNPDEVFQDISAELNNYYTFQYIEQTAKGDRKARPISDYEVDIYRNTYGSLGDQLADITYQYQDKIIRVKKQRPESEQSAEVKTLENERDRKLQAIIQNFTDKKRVKRKIEQERQAFLRTHQKDLVTATVDGRNYFDESYQFYFTDSVGRIYTNVERLENSHNQQQIKQVLSKGKSSPLYSLKNVAVIFDNEILPENTPDYLFHMENDDYWSGYYAIKAQSDLTKQIKTERKRVKQARVILVGGVVLLSVTLAALVIWLKQSHFSNRFAGRIQKIPFDLAILFGVLLLRFGLADIHTFVFNTRLIDYAVRHALFIYLSMLGAIIIVWDGYQRYQTGQLRWTRLKETTLLGRLYSWGVRTIPVGIRWFSSLLLYLLLTVVIVGVIFYSLMNGAQDGVILFLLVFGILWGYLTFRIGRKSNTFKKILLRPGEIVQQFGNQSAKAPLSLASLTTNLNEIEQMLTEAQRILKQNEEGKTELLTNISHDLRTPLTSIITYSDLLSSAQLSVAEQQEYAEIINEKAYRMKGLIDDLFEVTKMNSGGVALHKSKINMGQLLQQTLAEYQDELAEKELKICYTKPSEAIFVDVDGEKIWRVFDNLLSNVSKYALAGTRVHLKVKSTEEQVMIQLKNISKYELNEEASGLLERFRRGDDSRHTEGSGLGLAIANSIILLHNGHLSIEIDGDMFKITIWLPA